MTSVPFVPDISMQTDDINGRIEIALNLSMQVVALPSAVILRNLRLVVFTPCRIVNIYWHPGETCCSKFYRFKMGVFYQRSCGSI